ncbi:MAG: hypothetical protein H0U76_25625, partial [Ktedonobacteraceae bacterium]|nr:hypothetical protein [Ktedonobacteraceae bacterium]
MSLPLTKKKGVFTYVSSCQGHLSDVGKVLENAYYTLAGRLIGERESGVTVFLLTDELGSVLTSISAVAGSAAVTSNQAYSPYGT